jgi:hypothetical protein
MTSLEAEVTDTVRRFEALGLEALREEWRRRYGAPPTLRSADLLRHLLAWQAEALGGLDARLVQAIRAAGRTGARPRRTLAVGARLAREWQGQLHEVEVVEGGYLHQGRRHRSLSSVARAITGTRWNGPRFFGLRDANEAAA